MPVNLPTNLLRSFVAIVDYGSMQNAANKVFVTQSALSLQIKRLEELLQQTLFHRDGRRLGLTEAGDVLLDYARRMLAINDEAVVAVNLGRFSGTVRFGTVQDFADTMLSGLLAGFADLHPDAQIYARIGGTGELHALFDKGQLDIVLGYGAVGDPFTIRQASMGWYGALDVDAFPVLPLAVLEQPCRFRDAAIASLEQAHRPYRIAVEAPNISSLRAAVEAQLGITCRTGLFLGEAKRLSGPSLPALPDVACILRRGPDLGTAPNKLANLAIETILDM